MPIARRIVLLLSTIALAVALTGAARAQSPEILHSFSQIGTANGNIVIGPDGALYGSSSVGLFRLEPGGGPTIIHVFQDARWNSAELVESEGVIYGATLESIFRYDQALGFETLSAPDFQGGCPMYPPCPAPKLTLYNGVLYGTAIAPALIFEYDAQSGFRATYRFEGTTAVNILSPLVELDGVLYGTTSAGGKYGLGTLFRYEPGGGVTVLYDFDGMLGASPTEAMTASDGSLYGVTPSGGANDAGTIFRYDPGIGLTKVFDFQGASPNGKLVAYGGSFFGTTGLTYGLPRGFGSIYRFDPGAGITTQYSFRESDGDGQTPKSLVERDGLFFGEVGNSIFEYEPGAGLMILYVLPHDKDEGQSPARGLVAAGDKVLGVTSRGGSYNQGTIFQFEPGRGFTTLHSFAGNEGEGPVGPLVEVGGAYFGTTMYGGVNERGTIFKYESRGRFTTLYTFDGAHGSYPHSLLECGGSLCGATDTTLFQWTPGEGISTLVTGINAEALIAVGGSLYGTTNWGGVYSAGTLFRYDPVEGFTLLFSFDDGGDGGFPVGDLVEGGGVLYGTTSSGGFGGGGGTLFRYDPRNGFAVLFSFDGSLWDENPSLGFVDENGSIYGTTSRAVFRYDPNRGMTTLYAFYSQIGLGTPALVGPVVRIGAWLYGASSGAGDRGAGFVYRLFVEPLSRGRAVRRPGGSSP